MNCCPRDNCENPANFPHPCLRKQELADTDEERGELCNCCDYCTAQCADDV